MKYEIEKKNIRPQSVAYDEAKAAAGEIPQILSEILPRVMDYVQENGGELAGPPFTHYLSMGQTIHIQAGMPLQEKIEAGDGVDVGELPGGEVVTTVHVGPYDRLPEAYQAMAQWVQERDLPAEGTMWEYYWTDPEEEPNPENWKTEIFLSLKG